MGAFTYPPCCSRYRSRGARAPQGSGNVGQSSSRTSPPWLLPLLFGPGAEASTPRATCDLRNAVPRVPPSSSPPSASSTDGSARLARPFVLAPVPAFLVGSRSRVLWQFSQRQEIAKSPACHRRASRLRGTVRVLYLSVGAAKKQGRY